MIRIFIELNIPWTFAEETIIVTGSNAGLGKDAARHFIRLSTSKIILAVGNIKAGDEVKNGIETSTKCGATIVEVWNLDLAFDESVKSFAKRPSSLPRFDVILENAGIAGSDKFILTEGHESRIAVNVISTFLVALLMLPKLKASAWEFDIKLHLTIVSSEVHGHTKFPERNEPDIFQALDNEAKLLSDCYPASKLLEVLIVQQLSLSLEGSGVVLNMLNPGLCHSGLPCDANGMVKIVLTTLKFVLVRSAEMGESNARRCVNDAALWDFFKSKEGENAAFKVWKELCEIFEVIVPGIEQNI